MSDYPTIKVPGINGEPDLTITIAPPSSDFNADEMLAHFDHATGSLSPRCGYCDTAPLMKGLYDAYFGDDKAKRALIYALADGYGVPGTVPPQGYDWSGVRDSTPTARRRMAAALAAYEAIR